MYNKDEEKSSLTTERRAKMRYQIVGKNVDVTKSMEDAIYKKLKRIERYFKDDENIKCVVTVSTAHLDQTIEIAISTSNLDLRAKYTTNDFYEALDFCIDRLEGQMRKVKTKLDRSKKNSLGSNIQLDMLNEYDEESFNPNVVRRKKLSLTPMDEEEALTRMDALGHSFFIYLDSSSGLTNVIYEREDGGYGVIEIDE